MAAQCERAVRSGTEVYINQIKIPPVNAGLGMVPGMAAGDAPGGRILITVVGITLGTALMALGTPDAGAGFGGDKMTCRGRDANSLTTSTRIQYSQIKFCERFLCWLVGSNGHKSCQQ